MTPVTETIPQRVQSAMQTLAQRRALREVLDELCAQGSTALVLKGHALSQWLYSASQQRATADVDLLLPGRTEVDNIIEALGARGYEKLDDSFPGDMVCFEIACRGPVRDGQQVEIDLHWRLSNLPMFAFCFDFPELLRGSVALPALHPHARGLGPVHALLHACMHRVQNMPGGNHDDPKWVQDIELLSAFFTAEHWQRFTALAVQRRLSAVCLDAMLKVDGAPRAVVLELRSAAARQGLEVGHMHRWAYVQWQCWRAIPTFRQRLRWLRQRMWPDAEYLRHRHGRGHRTPVLRLLRMVSGLRRSWGGDRSA